MNDEIISNKLNVEDFKSISFILKNRNFLDKYISIKSEHDYIISTNIQKIYNSVINNHSSDLKALTNNVKLINEKINEIENIVIPEYKDMINIVETFYNENKILMLNDFDDKIMFSFFIDRKLIGANIEDENVFIPKFKKYLEAKT